MNRPSLRAASRDIPGRATRPNRADDWLLTYADAITLLLCLFMAMFSTALVRARHAASIHASPAPAPIEPLAATPRPAPTPIRPFAAFFTGLPTPTVDIPSDPDDAPVPPSAPVRLLTPVRLLAPAHPALPPAPATPAAPAALVSRVAAAGGELRQQGDRLTTIRMASETFFASGSADLSPSGRNILAGVAEQIVQPRYAGYTVTVEGHTDDNPIATALFPSNWELSAARAAAVVRFLAERGVDSTRLRAAGFADSLPLAANRDSSGRAIPENQARNRRVVIRLERVG